MVNCTGNLRMTGGEEMENHVKRAKKSSAVLIWGVVLCVVMTIIGFFLYVSLIPMQDFELLTQAEKVAFQRETALNYPLGMVMFYGGIAGSVLFTVLLVVRKFRSRKGKGIQG